MADRKGGWIQTYTGVHFYPLDPRPEDILPQDIAHALSLKCRYGGHCTRFYSVAEHSVIVSRSVPAEHALWGLLHDAAEAYLADIPRPIKGMLPQFAEMEALVMAAICDRFRLPRAEPLSVKDIDNAILANERRALLLPDGTPFSEWGARVPEIPGVTIIGYLPHQAEEMFMNRLKGLAYA